MTTVERLIELARHLLRGGQVPDRYSVEELIAFLEQHRNCAAASTPPDPEPTETGKHNRAVLTDLLEIRRIVQSEPELTAEVKAPAIPRRSKK